MLNIEKKTTAELITALTRDNRLLGGYREAVLLAEGDALNDALELMSQAEEDIHEIERELFSRGLLESLTSF